MSRAEVIEGTGRLANALLDTTEKDIVPLTAQQVSEGCKLFGAAILDRISCMTVIAATNNERESPLLHGEINCIQQFFKIPKDTRPDPKDCIFFATHEPCSLCLSGITWSGFNEFYYMFTYEDSRDLFAIPCKSHYLNVAFTIRDTPRLISPTSNFHRRH